MNCEICTLLLDDILLEDFAKPRIMKKHLDVLHASKNKELPTVSRIVIDDRQIADVRLDEIREHIKMLHEKVITFNNVS